MRNTEFDSKILIYRTRQLFLALAVFIMTIVFTVILMKNEKDGYHWFAIAIVLTGLGLLFIFFPMTEFWEYKPWQAKPRKIEQQER